MPYRASRRNLVCIRTSVEKHMEQCMRLLSATQCTYLERPSNPSFGKVLAVWRHAAYARRGTSLMATAGFHLGFVISGAGEGV